MKKALTIILIISLLFNLLCITSSVSAEEKKTFWENKIDNSIYKSPIYKNGKRLIYIKRTNIPQKTISKKLIEEYKYNPELYENQDKYENIIVPHITSQTINKLGVVEAYSTHKQYQLTGEKISPIDFALSEDYDNYVMTKRKAIKELYSEYNTQFSQKNIKNASDIVHKGAYTASFIVYATDAEIEKYAKCEDVELIVPFYDDPGEVDTIPAEQIQIGVDSFTGTKSSQFNYGNGYKGTGVKIGIVELKGGMYYSTSPQLSSIPSNQLEFIGDLVSNYNYGEYPEHATVVTSLIVGQPYEINGCTYEGVVPNATVYQVAAGGWSDALEAFDILAERGVSVINYSGGTSLFGEYYAYTDDGEIDQFIESTGITFVKSAGNSAGAITSPGKAYNAITVGNLWTKDYMTEGNVPTQPKIFPDSSYFEAEHLTNKPDVVAPGTGIEVVLSPNELYNGTGTSYAAPLVTGIVAQLHQAKPFLRYNPTATKAILIAGASHDGLYTLNDPNDDETTYLHDKTGAGLVNATNSVEIALNSQYYYGEFDLSTNYATPPTHRNFCNFYVPAGKKMRLVMTFHKIDMAPIPETGFEDNINFSVYEYDTGEFVTSSTSIYNNVEIVEFTATERTRFYVDVTLQSHIPASSTCYLPFSFAGMFIDE